MNEPVSCQWCGSAQSGTDGDDILFECGSWHSGSTPEFQWSQCKLNVAEQRISRAIDWLQKAQRYDLACYPTGAVLERCTHGDYIDADDVVKAIQILKGQQ